MDKVDIQTFIEALRDDDLITVIRCINADVDVNEYTSDWTPLHWYASTSHKEESHAAVTFLIENAKELGLNINARAKFMNEWTPLMLASESDATLVDILLKNAKESGLDVNLKSLENFTHYGGGMTALQVAVENGDLDVLEVYKKYLNELDIDTSGVWKTFERARDDFTPYDRQRLEEKVREIRNIKNDR